MNNGRWGTTTQHSTGNSKPVHEREKKKSVGGPRDEKALCVFSFRRCCLSCKCSHHGRAEGPNVADTSHLQSPLEMILSALPPTPSTPPPIPTHRRCPFSSSRGQCGVASAAPPPYPPLLHLVSAFEHLFIFRCEARRKKGEKYRQVGKKATNIVCFCLGEERCKEK